eukprot:TRINITY_DN14689_c0_g1_i1.p1 TRINITY_DN14689_c0_g1~~TRINITY_DN14689_c0_g1_i1.p1  ORF type:complete len:564 (-),score=73.00 TRINITY_DN14689_c0_g1_i1:15-1637(-)
MSETPRRVQSLHSYEDVFDPKSPQIKEQIVAMIGQYLQDEGYSAAAVTLLDEANIKRRQDARTRELTASMKRAILEGNWEEVDQLCSKNQFRNRKSFLYAVCKQQFLELIERQEHQLAFDLLTRRLKPLEDMESTASEFKDLCYVLTCRTVQESPKFRSWDGARGTSRQKLVEQFAGIMDFDASSDEIDPVKEVPPQRLLHLLKQSFIHQIQASRYKPKIAPRITSLLEDYSPFVLPNASRMVLRGHRDNVKCVDFVGDDGRFIVSGSSDNTVRIWRTEDGQCVHTLTGHAARVWDVCSDRSGSLIGSAAGDGSIKIWDMRSTTVGLMQTISGHEGDVYTTVFHPDQSHIVSGGYDRTVRLQDIRTNTCIKTFAGHTSSVSRAVCTRHGNLIISGSKDSTIRFWDVVSGLCIKTITSHLGEVTSVELNENNTQLLSAAKDNSYRLWDIRMIRPLKRFKGHQNTSKNFIRGSFGPKQSLVLGGSEDSNLYLWDIDSGNVVAKLAGHEGVVYSARWNAAQSLMVSCSHDSTVRMWWYDESQE